MKTRNAWMAALPLLAALVWAAPAQAHCDTLDGPVVSAAQRALDTGNVNLVLVWVQTNDEAEIRKAFQKARSVRRAGGEAKDLADTYFFETLVRLHRAGEGAAFTGLKPAGAIEPAVAAADKAIATGNASDLAKTILARNEKALHGRFERVMATKKYDANDVEAGRTNVRAYVDFVHYAEELYKAGDAGAPEHAHDAAPVHGRAHDAASARAH